MPAFSPNGKTKQIKLWFDPFAGLTPFAVNSIICKAQPQEYKVVALRECPVLDDMRVITSAEHAHEYWKAHVAGSPQFNPDVECCVVLLLNARTRIKGHHLVAVGSLDSVMVHPREAFRAAVVSASAVIMLMHNIIIRLEIPALPRLTFASRGN
jgi:hypothetical protein